MENLLPLLVAVPLGVAFLIVVFAHVKGLRRLPLLMAVLTVAGDLVFSVMLLCGKDLSLYIGRWGPGAGLKGVLGIELVCDGLTRLMLITINLVALVSIIFAGPYLKRYTKTWLFYALFLLMTGAMNAVVLAGDLFNLFVFIEVAAISSYALVGFGCESEELEAAFKYLVLGAVGSAFILLGITVLYAVTGHLNMGMISQVVGIVGPTSPAVLLAAAALMGGLALKAAMVPFHAWLPDAHPSAPAPISAMLSGVLIKAAGVYVLARLVFNVLGPTEGYAVVLIVLGAASMVIGVFLAVGQWDFKRLLAYHSISQMGYVVLAIGVGAEVVAKGGSMWIAELCLFGGLFHMFNHAAFKSLLFMAAGSVVHATGTRDLDALGGLVKRMPWTAAAFFVGSAAIAALPPLNGFVSEWLMFQALLQNVQLPSTGLNVVFTLAIAALALTGGLAVACFVKAYGMGFLALPRSAAAASAAEADVSMRVAMVLAAGACAGLGLGASWVVGPLLAVAATVVPAAAPITIGSGLTVYVSDGFASVSTVAVAVALAGALALSLAVLSLAGLRMRPRRYETWGCGRLLQTARMEYTATAFANPFTRIFDFFYRPVTRLEIDAHPESRFFVSRMAYANPTRFVVDEWVYRPVDRALRAATRWTVTIQSGSANAYLAYVLAVLLLLLVLA